MKESIEYPFYICNDNGIYTIYQFKMNDMYIEIANEEQFNNLDEYVKIMVETAYKTGKFGTYGTKVDIMNSI